MSIYRKYHDKLVKTIVGNHDNKYLTIRLYGDNILVLMKIK